MADPRLGAVRWVQITDTALDPALIHTAVHAPHCGAVVMMTGAVRDHDHGRPVSALEYRAHPDAEKFLRLCCEDVARRSGLQVAAAHRVGDLVVGDLALLAAVADAHRARAFEVCAELVDRIKAEVPIWKRQLFPEGTSEWVGL